MIAGWGKRILNHIKENTLNEITQHHTEIYNAIKKSAIRLEELIKQMNDIEGTLNENQSVHYKVKWINSANIIYGLYSWYALVYEASQNSERRKDKLTNAIKHINNILDYRKCAEYGDFKNWYRGDTKLNTKNLITLTQEVVDIL